VAFNLGAAFFADAKAHPTAFTLDQFDAHFDGLIATGTDESEVGDIDRRLPLHPTALGILTTSPEMPIDKIQPFNYGPIIFRKDVEHPATLAQIVSGYYLH